MEKPTWIEKLREIETQNHLVVRVFTKQDIEYAADRNLTDSEWAEVVRLFRKTELHEMPDLLCELAREVASDDEENEE